MADGKMGRNSGRFRAKVRKYACLSTHIQGVHKSLHYFRPAGVFAFVFAYFASVVVEIP